MRGAVLVTVLGLAVAGCATGPTRYPVVGERFHADPVAGRGPIAVAAAPGDNAADTPVFVAAVQNALTRAGFTPAPAGAPTPYRAIVTVSRTEQPLPPRSSGLSIGLGGGGFSGGRRGGGVGLGGGLSFPVGGSRARTGVVTDLAVRIVRGPDAIWDGHTRTLADAATAANDSAPLAQRLAGAMFAGFPGESGRSIEVR